MKERETERRGRNKGQGREGKRRRRRDIGEIEFVHLEPADICAIFNY